jgi:PadR family transcriptional regulator PadR
MGANREKSARVVACEATAKRIAGREASSRRRASRPIRDAGVSLAMLLTEVPDVENITSNASGASGGGSDYIVRATEGQVTRYGLGGFEQQVLLTILRLGGEAYSVPMVLEMEERGGREVSQAAVYIALRRLEEKGLVVSRMEAADRTDTGRERRWFSVTPTGLALLRETHRTMGRFWEGLEGIVERS